LRWFHLHASQSYQNAPIACITWEARSRAATFFLLGFEARRPRGQALGTCASSLCVLAAPGSRARQASDTRTGGGGLMPRGRKLAIWAGGVVGGVVTSPTGCCSYSIAWKHITRCLYRATLNHEAGSCTSGSNIVEEKKALFPVFFLGKIFSDDSTVLVYHCGVLCHVVLR
jgi:hypothetical protein